MADIIVEKLIFLYLDKRQHNSTKLVHVLNQMFTARGFKSDTELISFWE